MADEDNKAIVRRAWEELHNAANLALVDDLIAPEYTMHMGGRAVPAGPEHMRRFINGLFAAFPDYHETIEDMVAEGDKVVIRTRSTGTHRGEYLGVAPTGKQVTMRAIIIVRIADGMLVESWRQDDTLGLMRQLGAIPSP